MTMTDKELERYLEDVVENYLSEKSAEDLFEEFDLTVAEVFIHLFNTGMIDETELERITGV